MSSTPTTLTPELHEYLLSVSLRDLQPRIELEEGLRLRAKKSLDRMLEMAAHTVGKGDVGRPQIAGD